MNSTNNWADFPSLYAKYRKNETDFGFLEREFGLETWLCGAAINLLTDCISNPSKHQALPVILGARKIVSEKSIQFLCEKGFLKKIGTEIVAFSEKTFEEIELIAFNGDIKKNDSFAESKRSNPEPKKKLNVSRIWDALVKRANGNLSLVFTNQIGQEMDKEMNLPANSTYSNVLNCRNKKILTAISRGMGHGYDVTLLASTYEEAIQKLPPSSRNRRKSLLPQQSVQIPQLPKKSAEVETAIVHSHKEDPVSVARIIKKITEEISALDQQIQSLVLKKEQKIKDMEVLKKYERI